MLTPVPTPTKRCGCGQVFTREQWRALPLLGIQQLDDGVWTDMRNCHCGSTLLGPDLTVAANWLELSGLLEELLVSGKRPPMVLLDKWYSEAKP